MKIRVEYEPRQIRHIAVQCPSCNNWFHGYGITEDLLRYEVDVHFAQFKCPVCFHIFGANAHSNYNSNMIIEEVGYPEIYKDCLQKKEVWE